MNLGHVITIDDDILLILAKKHPHITNLRLLSMNYKASTVGFFNLIEKLPFLESLELGSCSNVFYLQKLKIQHKKLRVLRLRTLVYLDSIVGILQAFPNLQELDLYLPY